MPLSRLRVSLRKFWFYQVTIVGIAGAISIIAMDIALSASLSGTADIVDADTIKVGGIPVRLDGIDAPEGRQTCELGNKSYACGKRAIEALMELIGGRPVQCRIVGRDDFKRALGICTVGDDELNAAMVKNGWALAAVKFSNRYVGEEKLAESAKRGLWAGTFTEPWEWRLKKTEVAAEDRDCVIKGNISSKGERIYHLPFQHFYSRTEIGEASGERWFCTEDEALAAGWRRSLR